MSYEKDMLNNLSDVPDEFEPLQQTLDVWMDLPEPDLPPEETAPENAREPEPAPAPEPASAFPPEEAGYEQTVMPEYTAESDEEIADAIAQAVSVAFHGEPEYHPESQAAMEEPEEEPAAEAEPVQEETPEEAPAPEEQPEEETAEASETPETSAEPAAEEKQKEAKPDKKQVPKNKKSEVRYHLPPKQKKIPRGSVHTGFLKSVNETMGDIRARQREDLPGSGASVKTAERRYTRIEGIARKTNLVHTVILILMIMALMGRRFNWMLLGFLGGTTGVHAAAILTVVAMIAGWRTVARAVQDAVFLRFSFQSLLLLTTILSMLEMLLHRNEQSLLPLLCIGWCLSGKADLMEVRAKLRSLRGVMLSGKNRTGVRVRRRLWERMDCIGRAPAGTAGFVRHLEERDSWSTGWSVFSILLLALCLIVGAYLTAKTGTSYLTILVTLLTVSMPVAAAMTGARSFFLLSGALGRSGVLAGWYGAKMLSGRKTVLTYDSDLFPSGTITHRGVRVYGNQTAQLLISYGASLIVRGDNGLTEPFLKLLSETGGQIHHVSRFQVTEGGLSGQIHGVFVAVGTYNFMQLMGAMPPRDAPKNGLFIAINGQIAGLFAIRYRVKAGSVGGFARFTAQPLLTPLAAMKHLCVNPSYLKNWFKIPVGEMICPKVDTRWKLAAPGRFARGNTCGFIMAEGINPYSRLVAGARRMHTMGWTMTAVSIATSLVLFFMTVSRIAAGTELITAGRLLLIQLLTYLAVEIWSRRAAN